MATQQHKTVPCEAIAVENYGGAKLFGRLYIKQDTSWIPQLQKLPSNMVRLKGQIGVWEKQFDAYFTMPTWAQNTGLLPYSMQCILKIDYLIVQPIKCLLLHIVVNVLMQNGYGLLDVQLWSAIWIAR